MPRPGPPSPAGGGFARLLDEAGAVLRLHHALERVEVALLLGDHRDVERDEHLPELVQKHTLNGIIDLLIQKYRARRIKSVIHFRRIMEAYEVADDQRAKVLQRLRSYVENVDLETRQVFDEFVVDERRIRNAIDACYEFIRELRRLKIDYTLDRDELRAALEEVKEFAEESIAKLEGSDPSAEV